MNHLYRLQPYASIYMYQLYQPRSLQLHTRIVQGGDPRTGHTGTAHTCHAHDMCMHMCMSVHAQHDNMHNINMM